MAGDAAGQITASLTLDISKFTKALGDAKKAVSDMQKTASQAASSGGGGDAAASSAKKAKKAADEQKQSIASVVRQYKNLVNAVGNGEISQDRFVKGMQKAREQANKLKSGLDQDTDAYIKLGTVSKQAREQIDRVAESQRRSAEQAKKAADAIVAQKDREAAAAKRAADKKIKEAEREQRKLAAAAKKQLSTRPPDLAVGIMKTARKDVAALNKEIGRGAITYSAAAQQLDILEKEIIQAGSGAKRGTEAFRQFQTSMESATGAKRFISNQQAMQRSANETAAALKGSSSKMGGIFKVMGAGMASSSRSMVMSLTNITEAFQKGQMGGRMLSTFLLGDLMDAMMIGSFATDGLVKSANALPASATAAKAAMMGVAKIFPIAMVGANLLAAGIGILVRKLSSSGKSAKEAKEEISKFDQQAKDTVLAVRHLERFAGDLALIFDGLKKSAKGTAKVLITVGENVSKLKDVKTFLSDIKKQQQDMSAKTAGEKVVLDAQKTLQALREEAEKARVSFETFTAQTLKLESQMSSYRARVASLEKQIKSSTGHTMSGGMAVDAYKQKIEVLKDKMSVLGVTILQHQEYLDGATSGYSSARLGAEKFAEGLDLIKQKAAELDKSDKDGEKESKREKLVARLIGQYQRLQKLLSASAGSMLEQDVEKAPKFAHQMAAILKIIKKYKSSVESASNFLQEKKDNEFLDAIEKNNEALEDFKQRAEEAKKRASDLLRETGKQTTLKMGIGTSSQVSGPDAMMAQSLGISSPGATSMDVTKIGQMTGVQKDAQKLMGKNALSEKNLAGIKDFKSSLTNMGATADMASGSMSALTSIGIQGAALPGMLSLGQGAMDFVTSIFSGDFSSVFEQMGAMLGQIGGMVANLIAPGLGEMLGPVFEVIGATIGAFFDQMISRIEVPSISDPEKMYGMDEVINAAFEQPLKEVAPLFTPLAEGLHFLASNVGGLLADMASAFGPTIGMLGTLFKTLANIVFSVIGILFPVFNVIGHLFNAVATGIRPLLTLLDPIINILTVFLMTITSSVGAILNVAITVMALLSPLQMAAGAIDFVAQLIHSVAVEFGNMVSSVFEFFQEILTDLVEKLDDLGIGWATDGLEEQLTNLAGTMGGLAENIEAAGKGLGAFGSSMDTTIMGLDEANDLRDKQNKDASKVLNAPQGFKVEKYRYEAMNPEQSNPFTGASLDGSGGMVINIENIFVDDGTDLLDQLNDANQQGGLPGNGGF